MATRLGEILVRKKVLTEDQVETILAEQHERSRPFGLLAEQLFGGSEEVIEQAWVEQYIALAQHVDVTVIPREPGIGEAVSSRRCWQFGVFPIKEDGPELVLATTPELLVRALRFASRVLERPCYFVITSQESLAQALHEHHPIPGLGAHNLEPAAAA